MPARIVRERKPLIAVLLVATCLQARTFYLDATGGKDTNDGLTRSSPWQTLSTLRPRSLASGDTVLLKRGAVWANQSMVVQGSGTAERPVVVGDYGSPSAAAPRISDTGTVVVRIAANHVVVQNLAVTGPRAVCVTNSGSGRTDITIRGLDVFDCVTGIGLSLADGGRIEDNQIRNMHFSPTGSGAIGIGVTSSSNVRVTGNVLRDCIGKDTSNHADGGAVELFRSNRGIEISGNRALRCYGFLEGGGLKGDTIRDLVVRSNIALECKALVWLNLRTPTDSSDIWGVAYDAVAIANNSFVQNRSWSGSPVGCSGTLPDSNQVVLVNNILAGDSMGGSIYKGGFHRANNLLWSGCARLTGIQTASGELNLAPQLVIDTGRIGCLASPGSPVVKAGIRSSQAAALGFPRIAVGVLPDTAIDIGAFELYKIPDPPAQNRKALELHVLPRKLVLESDLDLDSQGLLSIFDLGGRSIARTGFLVNGGRSSTNLPFDRAGRPVVVSVDLDGERAAALVPGF